MNGRRRAGSRLSLTVVPLPPASQPGASRGLMAAAEVLRSETSIPGAGQKVQCILALTGTGYLPGTAGHVKKVVDLHFQGEMDQGNVTFQSQLALDFIVTVGDGLGAEVQVFGNGSG